MKYEWTVYCGGILIDIATDAEVAQMMRDFSNIVMLPKEGVVLIGELA
jgi:hypothetical protein